MQTEQPMKYIIIQEREPKNEASKRPPRRCLVIFDARLSAVQVCAGIVSRNHDVVSDGNIVEQGPWDAPGNEIGQQAEAWQAVASLLDELAPGWLHKQGTAQENALAAIRQLARLGEGYVGFDPAKPSADYSVVVEQIHTHDNQILQETFAPVAQVCECEACQLLGNRMERAQ